MKKEFILDENEYYKLSEVDVFKEYPVEYWDVDETISQLAYLTHDYFRYYGKFPSKIGKNIIEDEIIRKSVNVSEDFIFDNYCGSGTSLVEAKIAGFDSAGIDINPFAVLSSRVKTSNLKIDRLKYQWAELSNTLEALFNLDTEELTLLKQDVDPMVIESIEKAQREIYIQFNDITKWFDENVIRDLAIIKTALLGLKKDRYREFFVLGFFAIIRRVSRAYDGEVRPHINKKKKYRDVKQAYYKKINEMIDTMQDWNRVTNEEVYSDSFISSNSDKKRIRDIINKIETKTNKKMGLVISHPPYLNCFDYIPVYKLKFLWAYGFDEIYGEFDYERIKALEVKSYPVSNDKHINRYFEHHEKVYEIIYDNLKPGGYCCVVIGDCTVKKQLFSVHKSFINIMENIGFLVEKVVYRSTNYGLGKYAYDFRADYHEDENGKKDAIIFFKKNHC